MVAQKILFPDYPMGLDFIASTCTDIPYYKADGKRWFKIGGLWETLWHYNGMDSVTCAAASPVQHEDLEKQGNTVTYDEQCRIIEPLVYMMRKGIRVDVEGMKKADVEMKEQIGNLQEQLNSVAGRELNVNSFPQMREYLYGVLGHKPYLKKGKITTDDIALTRLLRKGVKEAGIAKQIRTLRKLSSTYTDISKIDSDGYIRCSYNPVGTKTGRLSSSEDIYDKGMNMQNWPHHLLKYLLADEGYVYYGLDLSQAENRIVAYIGRIQRMMQAFENEEDVHALTAGLIFDKPVDKISDEEGSSDLGTGAYSERFWGKKSNHSFNYDLGYKSFAMRMEMEERQAKWIVERYHKIYPEVRGNYHTMVRMNLSKDRTLTNLFGRKRLFLGEWGDNLFKDAYAQIPQSTVADKINRQGLSYIYYNQEKFSPVELLVQVHDSIGLQLPLSLPWIKHAEILLDIKTSLEAPLDTGAIEFVIPVDIQMGLNLFKKEGKEFKHNEIPLSAPNFAKELEQTYNGLIKE